jgi:glyoxalase family protein
MYCRTPSGLLMELCHSGDRGFFIDETAEELGTHMCIPPHWEHRRAELDQLEELDTEETMAV